MTHDDKESSSQNARIIGVAIVSALLGTHALELGDLIILYFDRWTGEDQPNKKSRVEFGLLVLGFGFLVLTALEILKWRRAAQAANFESVLSAIIVGLIGGFFSIVKNTASKDGYLTGDTANALFYLVAIGAVFVLPISVVVRNPASARFIFGLCVASGVAFLAGGILLLAMKNIGTFCSGGACGQSLESMHFNPSTTSFFMSSPMAAALFAPWALLSVDPVVRPQRWPSSAGHWKYGWFLMFLVIMLGLVTVYALGIYWPKHSGEPGGWLHHYSVPIYTVFICFLLLQMGVVVFAMLYLFALRRFRRILGGTSTWLLSAFLIGSGLSQVVIWLLPSPEMQGWIKQALFVFSHGMTCLLTIGACFLGHRISQNSPDH